MHPEMRRPASRTAVFGLARRNKASAKFEAPQSWLGWEADLLREPYSGSCCGAGSWLSCVLASLSRGGLVAQLASRLSASCEGELGSVV